MDVAATTRLLGQALMSFRTHAPELRDLDAALGDGDLGITVDTGCRAVVEALGDHPPAQTPGELLSRAARAFAAANPSTLAALVGGALLAAARAVDDAPAFDREVTLAVVDAAAASIMARGKAQLGDKTILDALVPSAAAMRDEPDAVRALVAGIAAARAGIERTTTLRSQRGRAAWVGERSIGRPDPGAVAYVRFLESLLDAWPEQTAVR